MAQMVEIRVRVSAALHKQLGIDDFSVRLANDVLSQRGAKSKVRGACERTARPVPPSMSMCVYHIQDPGRTPR
jgi:hypothetical protein